MIGETLSEFPFNYEFVGWRRLHPTMISPKGSDKSNMYSSTLLFDCPVPKEYQSLVASGETVLSDGTPTLRVDLIPIRTSPRYGLDEVYLTEDMAGPKNMWQYGNITSKRGLWREKNATVIGFDPKKRFGDNHVLPLVEASGRWANLPICIPPSAKELQHDREAKPVEEGTPKSAVEESNRPFELVACTWASASYATRGKGQPATNSSLLRLSEWLEFHLMVGFDHIFVYDNSAANTPTDTLRPVLDRFPADKVTRVDWPQVVCNNNEPNAPNPGERSSQYAAENSCRVRYGDMTKWMASFDVDEYMVPMGNFTNLKDMLRKIPDNIHIVDLRSSRTKLRIDASVPVKKGDNRFMQKDPKKSYLESYNCDTVPLPKPYTGDRARKEIYRTDFVLYHFVHYSLVTQNTLVQYKDASPNQKWQREAENETINNPEYVTDEINEAILVHAKGGKEGMLPWKQRCKVEKNRNQCNFGFPWPSRMDYATLDGVARNGNGYFYNCHSNSRIKDFWVPRLEKAISERRR